MKRLLLLLMLFSTPVLAEEPIELTCDQRGTAVPLIIDLARNRVKLHMQPFVEIYYSDEGFIVWIVNGLKEKNPRFGTYVLERKTGILNVWMFQPDLGMPPYEFQCIRPI